MKVVLATCPENWITKKYLPSLGLLYIASHLGSQGHKVIIVDAPAERYTIEETAKKIASHNPDAVGITGTTHNRFNAIRVMNKLKELMPNVPIITGGSHFGRAPIDALQNVPAIDVIFREEGEVTTEELLEAFEKGTDMKNIRGISFRDKDGRIIQTPPREYLKDLNLLPPPAWHLLDFSKYDETYLEGENLIQSEERTKAVGIISGRGCPNECIFCTDAGFKTFRLRSPTLFVDEIEILNKKYGFRGFDIWDDTFTIDRKHVFAVCDEIMKRGLDIKWYARSRANTINSEILAYMKKAGCAIVGYGAESGSQRILNIMRKRITVQQIIDAVDMTIKNGMTCKTFWIHSFPGETLYDIKLTIDLMRKVYKMAGHPEAPPHANFATIYPGTALEFIAKQEGFFPPGFSWNKYIEFPQPKLVGMDATVPLYEQKWLTIVQILAFAYRYNNKPKKLVRKVIRGFVRSRNINDIKSLAKMGRDYVFGEGGLLKPVKEREEEEGIKIISY